MNLRKIMIAATLLSLSASPFSTFARTRVHAEGGGTSGYGTIDKTTEDNGDVEINCTGPGTSACPGLASIKASDRPYYTYAWDQIFVYHNMSGNYSDPGGNVSWSAFSSATGIVSYDIKINF